MNVYFVAVSEVDTTKLFELFTHAVFLGQIAPEKKENYRALFYRTEDDRAKRFVKTIDYIDNLGNWSTLPGKINQEPRNSLNEGLDKYLGSWLKGSPATRRVCKKFRDIYPVPVKIPFAFDPSIQQQREMFLQNWERSPAIIQDHASDHILLLTGCGPQALCRFASKLLPLFEKHLGFLALYYNTQHTTPSIKLALLSPFQGRVNAVATLATVAYLKQLVFEHPPENPKGGAIILVKPFNRAPQSALNEMYLSAQNKFSPGEYVVYMGPGDLGVGKCDFWIGRVQDIEHSFVVVNRQYNPKTEDWKDPVWLLPLFIGKLC